MSWITTISGKRVELLAPTPESIDIYDIAYGLARIQRYTGHTKRPWSVLDHSLLVCSLLPPELQLEGLMHDSPEAYIGDVSRPLKLAMRSLTPAGVLLGVSRRPTA